MKESYKDQRIYQNDPLPTFTEIKEHVGEKGLSAFNKLIEFIENNYDFEREIYFGGKNYGVMVRYRRKGKTLVQIFPEINGFEIVLIYGKKERESFENQKEKFSDYINSIYDNTKQYHDGKWMLIRIENTKYIKELFEMIKIKKSPKNSLEKAL